MPCFCKTSQTWLFVLAGILCILFYWTNYCKNKACTDDKWLLASFLTKIILSQRGSMIIPVFSSFLWLKIQTMCLFYWNKTPELLRQKVCLRGKAVHVPSNMNDDKFDMLCQKWLCSSFFFFASKYAYCCIIHIMHEY